LPPVPPGRPPRVAVVLTQLSFGGAEKQTFELLRLLRGTPWEPVLVITLSTIVEPYGPRIRDLGYRLEVLPRSSSLDVRRLTRTAHLLRREKIDLVHAVHLLASGYSWLACVGSRSRVLPTVRGTVVRPAWVKRVVYRSMFRGSRVTLVNSHRGAEFICRYFSAPSGRVTVVPNGVDFDLLRRVADPPVLRRELGLAAGSEIIGYVGKDHPVKNLDLLVHSCGELLRRRPAAHLVLIGNKLGCDRRDLLAAGLPAGRAHFLGVRTDVPALLKDMDVLALTSDSEGSPNIVLEALGVGTPVVSTDVGDVRCMIDHGRTGLVVPIRDAAAMTGALQTVLDDVEAFRRRVREGWGLLEEGFALESMVRSTVEQWRRVLA